MCINPHESKPQTNGCFGWPWARITHIKLIFGIKPFFLSKNMVYLTHGIPFIHLFQYTKICFTLNDIYIYLTNQLSDNSKICIAGFVGYIKVQKVQIPFTFSWKCYLVVALLFGYLAKDVQQSCCKDHRKSIWFADRKSSRTSCINQDYS